MTATTTSLPPTPTPIGPGDIMGIIYVSMAGVVFIFCVMVLLSFVKIVLSMMQFAGHFGWQLLKKCWIRMLVPILFWRCGCGGIKLGFVCPRSLAQNGIQVTTECECEVLAREQVPLITRPPTVELDFIPEAMVAGSALTDMAEPSAQVSILQDERHIGHAVRMGSWLVLPHHVYKRATRMTLKKGTVRVEVGSLPFQWLADDLVAVKMINQMSPLGLKSAKIGFGDITSVVSRSRGSTGTVTPHNRMGYLSYSGSTLPGYSGAALMAGRRLRGIHLGNMALDKNLAIDAQLVKILLENELFMDEEDVEEQVGVDVEDSGDWIDVTDEVKFSRSARAAGKRLRRNAAGRFEVTGLDELAAKKKILDEEYQQAFEEELEKVVSTARENLKRRGFDLTDRDEAKLSSKTRTKYFGEAAAPEVRVNEQPMPYKPESAVADNVGILTRVMKEQETQVSTITADKAVQWPAKYKVRTSLPRRVARVFAPEYVEEAAQPEDVPPEVDFRPEPRPRPRTMRPPAVVISSNSMDSDDEYLQEEEDPLLTMMSSTLLKVSSLEKKISKLNRMTFRVGGRKKKVDPSNST